MTLGVWLSAGPLDLVGLEAANTNIQTLRGLAHESANALDVRVPAARRTTMRVGNLFPEGRFPTADFTDGCHSGRECSRSGMDGQPAPPKMAL